MFLRVLPNNFVGFPLQFTLIIALWSARRPARDRAGQVLVGLVAEAGGQGGGDLDRRAGLVP